VKVCRSCLIEKNLDEFPDRKNREDGKDSYCRICYNIKSNDYYHKNKDTIAKANKLRYERNKDKVISSNILYRNKNKEKVNAWYRDYSHKIRNEFLDMYGGRCECCGEIEYVFLTIEHVKGQIGIKRKETGKNAYKKALSNYRPDLYKILCMNCNSATRFGRICPHQLGDTYESIHSNTDI
jgi:hypothetical protein